MSSTAWSSGDHYEPFMGRWSRLVGADFLDWFDAPPGLRWLDIGCGTGALTEAIALSADPRQLTGVDPSESFVDFARSRLGDRAIIEVADATHLPLDEDAVDVAVAGLVLNFVTDLVRSLAEISRVVHPGGRAGAYVWDYAGGMQFLDLFWQAAGEVDASARDFYESSRFGGWDRGRLERLLASIGTHAESHEIVVPTVFANFDDYWTPFLGGQGPAPSYVKSLDADRLAELREVVRSSLPIAADGTISLTARAWAVRCIVN